MYEEKNLSKTFWTPLLEFTILSINFPTFLIRFDVRGFPFRMP